MLWSCVLGICALVQLASCQMGMEPAGPPSVGISNNYRDVLLSLLSGPDPAGTPNQQPTGRQLSQLLPAGPAQPAAYDPLSSKYTGAKADMSMSAILNSFNIPEQRSRQPAPSQNSGFRNEYYTAPSKTSLVSEFNPSASAHPSHGSPPAQDFHMATKTTSHSSISTGPHSSISTGPHSSISTGPHSSINTGPTSVGSHPAADPYQSIMDSLMQPGAGGNHPVSGGATSPANKAISDVFGPHPVLGGQPASLKATGQQPHVHKTPSLGSMLGTMPGSSTSSGTSLPSGAAPVKPKTTSTGNVLPSAPRNPLMNKLQAMMYTFKVTKLAPIMRLYEQEGCVNPIPILPTKMQGVAKAAFAEGCQSPNANSYCMMAQLKTPGSTMKNINTQLMMQNMMSPQAKASINKMLTNMSPSNMMNNFMGGSSGMMMQGLMGGGGEAMNNPEMFDRVKAMRKKLFPLECQEVAMSNMFKIGTCCYGKVKLSQNYIMSHFFSGSAGAK